MLQAAWDAGVPMRWVTGDAVYGDATFVRDGVHAAGRWYVLGVSSTTPVWRERPVVAVPPWSGRGRRPTQPQVVESTPGWVTVAEAVAAVPAARWHRLAVQDGEKGPIWAEWTRLRVVERADGLPGRTVWLLARRSVADPTEIKYFLSNAPTTLALPTLARVAATRFAVEQCFEEAKGEAGLDEYEVRRWHSWHRHITLTMMAHAWLAVRRAADTEAVPDRVDEKGGGGSVGPAHGARSAPTAGDRSAAA
jgi:SRSO17 transposase